MPAQLPVAINENPFLTFWNLGYQRLLPIVPPGAPLLPGSTLYLRMRDDQTKDVRGKVPGILRDGLWQGLDLNKIESTPADFPLWLSWGSGVGIKLGQGFYFIDADSTNVQYAAIIHRIVTEMFGDLPRRIGRVPKTGYLIRTTDLYPYRKITFGAAQERVEILSEGKQFVGYGQHPGTGKPYYWPDGIPHYDSIPVFAPERLDDLLNALAEALPEAIVDRSRGTDGDAPDQRLLRADPDTIRKAVKAMGNRDFPSREDYLDVLYAVKASFGEGREAEALEVCQDWAEEWVGIDGKTNDPDTVASDFRRCVPPFYRGKNWLFETAIRVSGGKFTQATAVEHYLDEPAPEPLFPPEEGTREALLAAGESADSLDYYTRRSLTDVFELPDAKYLIDKHVSDAGVGILFGAPGTGKSFIALDMALAVAFGFKDWQGYAINADEPLTVVYLAGEGARGYKTRALAWMQHRGIPRENAASANFELIDDSVNFMKAEDVDKLVRTMRLGGKKVGLVFVDTVSRVIPGADENLQKDMTVFVEACKRIEKAFGCAVVGVHHTNKGGEMRGSSVFEGGGDFIFRLDRRKGERVGRLQCYKMKDGSEDGWDQPYRFSAVEIEGTANPQGLPLTSLVVDRCTVEESAKTGGLTPEKVEAVFEAIRAAAEAGKPWSLKANVRGGERFYQNRMLHDFEVERSTAESAMLTWLGEGRIKDGTINKKRNLKGLYVPRNSVTEPAKTSVFD